MSTAWSMTTKGAKAVCTTGTEAAPSTSAHGMGLGSDSSGRRAVQSLVVHIETAGTMTAGGLLKAYLWNPLGNSEAGQWNPCPDLDLSVQALASQSFPGFQIAGPDSRIAFVPSGVGLGCTIFLNVTN